MSARAGGRPMPTDSKFELYTWFFMRVSGILLLFLALGHLVIMHIINNIDIIDYSFVAARYANAFWRLYDAFLLVLALIHGLNGLRIVVDDYVNRPGWRVFALTMVYLLGFIGIVVGSYTILAFQP